MLLSKLPPWSSVPPGGAHAAFVAQDRRRRMYNILTIIGVIVVVLAVLAFFGLR
jgi:hypothetical protein